DCRQDGACSQGPGIGIDQAKGYVLINCDSAARYLRCSARAPIELPFIIRNRIESQTAPDPYDWAALGVERDNSAVLYRDCSSDCSISFECAIADEHWARPRGRAARISYKECAVLDSCTTAVGVGAR